MAESKTYVAPEHPKFRVKLRGKLRFFEAHQLILTNAKDIAAMDAALNKPGSSLRRFIRVVDRAAAEKMAAELKAAARPAAARGAFTTAHHVQNTLAQRDAELTAQGATAEQADAIREELAKDSLVITEAAKEAAAEVLQTEETKPTSPNLGLKLRVGK